MKILTRRFSNKTAMEQLLPLIDRATYNTSGNESQAAYLLRSSSICSLNVLSRLQSIEIIDKECVLLSLLCEKFVATKWRIYKGILTSSRLLREGNSRGRKECDLFLSTRLPEFTKDINSRLEMKKRV